MSLIEKVLILDDNESNLLFFEVLFGQLTGQYKVFTATTGAQGVSLVKLQHIQFVVSAWEMNPMPGTIFIQKIRKDRVNAHLPCLIYSKKMTDEDIALTTELSLNNIIKMPFDKSQVRDIITKMIADEENITSIEKKLRKVEFLSGEGKYSDALNQINESVMQKSPEGRGFALAGEAWLGMRNFEKAEEYLKKALAINPGNFQASRLLAKCYSQMGRHEESIAILEQRLSESPKSLISLLSLGSAYASANQYDNAREVFNRVEKVDKEFEGLNDERGILAFREGNISLAAKFLAETTQGDEIARSFNDLGIAQISVKSFDKGITLYLNAISLLKEKAKLHLLKYNLALAYYKKSDLENSFSYFCESYLEEPSYEKAYSSLAKVSKELKLAGKAADRSLVEKVKEARLLFKEVTPKAPEVEDEAV